MEYVTAGQVCARLAAAGVTPALLRRWVADGRLDPLRGVDGQPLRLPEPGGRGRQNVYRWPDVVAVEWATRISPGGRPRRPRS